MATKAWRVTLNRKGIDTVFQDFDGITSADVKRSLVNYDGYDPSITVRRQYHFGKHPRPYVGHTKDGTTEVFRAVKPTETTHPQYNAVVGPFRTARAAKFMMQCGNNNPHVQSVADAERIVKTQV